MFLGQFVDIRSSRDDECCAILVGSVINCLKIENFE